MSAPRRQGSGVTGTADSQALLTLQTDVAPRSEAGALNSLVRSVAHSSTHLLTRFIFSTKQRGSRLPPLV